MQNEFCMQARPEVGGKEKGRRESWGGNLVVASCHGGGHVVEYGKRPVVVASELVATGGGCCLSPPLCRDTEVSFVSFPLLLLFLFFPLPRLFSVSSLLVLLFSFSFFFPLLFPSSVLPCFSSNSQNPPPVFLSLPLSHLPPHNHSSSKTSPASVTYKCRGEVATLSCPSSG